MQMKLFYGTEKDGAIQKRIGAQKTEVLCAFAIVRMRK